MNSKKNTMWIQTFTGKKFYPFDPKPEDVCLEDIAHALSLKCRFGGHSKYFYSVGEHCLRMVESSLPGDRILMLFHDVSEAYLPDICTPIKDVFTGFRTAEKDILKAVGDKFGFKVPKSGLPKEIKDADRILAATERRDLMQDVDYVWPNSFPSPLNNVIHPCKPAHIEKTFMVVAQFLLEI